MKKLIQSTAMAAAAMTLMVSASANTIDLGTVWDSSNPPSQVLGSMASSGGGDFATAASLATALNSIAGTTYAAADIHKTDAPPMSNAPSNTSNQFSVEAGWKYLIVSYDGKNGGAIVIQLDGAAALVPYYSYDYWWNGSSTESYAVTHYGVAGSVPDGGATAGLLGLGMLGLVAASRRKA